MLKLLQRNGSNDEARTSLRVSGTAGETISLKFEIVSDELVPELHVSAEAQGASDAHIKVDIFVVKSWQAAGVGIYQSTPMTVEELLLKDDRIELKDRYKRQIKNWRDVFKPSWFYEAPKIPDHEDVRTALEEGQRKSFLARVHVPEGIYSGLHKSELVCKADGKELLHAPIEVSISPVKLIKPPQDFFIWYKGRLDRHYPQHYVTEDQFRLQLKDISEHEFTSISITEVDTQLAQKAIDIAEEIGFDKIVLVPPLPELTKLRFRKAQPVIYVSDELDMHVEFPEQQNPEALIGYHQFNWTRAQTVNGASTMASLLNHTFIKRLGNANDIGHVPRIISLYLNRNREYLQFIDQLKDSMTSELYYYWQCYMEKPSLNRVLAGAYLWKSGAAGISPYCYQHMPVHPNSPFNDFDEWEPNFHESGIKRPFKDHMTTYPARNGVIPTLQWEALRDGITDFKYWFTLHHWIEKCMTSQIPTAVELALAAKKRSNDILCRIDLTTITINSETEQEPYRDIQPHEYEEFRNQLRADIEALTDVLMA